MNSPELNDKKQEKTSRRIIFVLVLAVVSLLIFGGFELKMNLPLLFKKYQNILSNVQFSHRVMTTTLFIKGDKSDYILHEDWPEILDVLPNSQLRTISEAGHWVHADQQLEIFDIIIDFIKE